MFILLTYKYCNYIFFLQLFISIILPQGSRLEIEPTLSHYAIFENWGGFDPPAINAQMCIRDSLSTIEKFRILLIQFYKYSFVNLLRFRVSE